MSLPIQPQEIYKRTAQRLNLSEDYVKDFVENFYEINKTSMFDISYVLFYLSGLGRFILKPLRFYRKKKRLKVLVDKFEERKDDRGLMIKRELIQRYAYFEKATTDVDDLDLYIRKRMYKELRNEAKTQD